MEALEALTIGRVDAVVEDRNLDFLGPVPRSEHEGAARCVVVDARDGLGQIQIGGRVIDPNHLLAYGRERYAKDRSVGGRGIRRLICHRFANRYGGLGIVVCDGPRARAVVDDRARAVTGELKPERLIVLIGRVAENGNGHGFRHVARGKVEGTGDVLEVNAGNTRAATRGRQPHRREIHRNRGRGRLVERYVEYRVALAGVALRNMNVASRKAGGSVFVENGPDPARVRNVNLLTGSA